MHLTESCDEGAPRLITNVETTPATTPDDNMVEVVHRSLARRELLPSEHLVDKGYTDAKVLVVSQREHGVELIGPVAQDPSWQSRENAGFDKSAFIVNWERKVVTCPAGKKSISWLPSTYPAKGTVFEARFARRDCTPCASRPLCTRAKQEPRIIGLQTREYHETLQLLRKRQTTGEFRKSYAARAGIESTHAQAIRRSGLRRARYRGMAKTHLQHVVTAVAINLLRIAAWTMRNTHWENPLLPLRSPLSSKPHEFATTVNIAVTRSNLSVGLVIAEQGSVPMVCGPKRACRWAGGSAVETEACHRNLHGRRAAGDGSAVFGGELAGSG